MALHDDTVDIDNSVLKSFEKTAIILGTEGEGLKQSTIESCYYIVKISMAEGIDSLNVSSIKCCGFLGTLKIVLFDKDFFLYAYISLKIVCYSIYKRCIVFLCFNGSVKNCNIVI